MVRFVIFGSPSPESNRSEDTKLEVCPLKVQMSVPEFAFNKLRDFDFQFYDSTEGCWKDA